MRDFWKAIAEFDARTADPHFCWALLRMEEQRYIKIKNGKILPTGKVAQVSPEAILRRSVPRWECNVAKAALVMEAEGLLTIDGGCLKLTEKGRQKGIDLKWARGESALPHASEDIGEGLIDAAHPGEVEIEVDDEVYQYLLERQQPGEGIGDVILFLLRKVIFVRCDAVGSVDG